MEEVVLLFASMFCLKNVFWHVVWYVLSMCWTFWMCFTLFYGVFVLVFFGVLYGCFRYFVSRSLVACFHFLW